MKSYYEHRMRFKVGDLVDIVDKIQSVDIDLDLDTEWTPFDDHGSLIKKVESHDEHTTPSDYTAVLYSSEEDRALYWHSHPAMESGIIYGYATCYIGEVDKTGNKIEIKEVIELSPGNVWEIPKGVIHLFHFKSKSFLMIGWCPKFDRSDWKARFAVPEEKSKEEIEEVYKNLIIGAKNIFK
jgi:hypothetical protein